MQNLFRKEAIEHQGQKLDGEVTIATHISFNWILLIITCVVFIGASYLFLGEYHKKEVVKGYLKPKSGLSKVYPVNSGVIVKVFVNEGDFVKQGQLLARIKTERILASGEELNSQVLKQLHQQKRLLLQSINNQSLTQSAQLKQLKAKLENTSEQISITHRQKQLLAERIKLIKSKYKDTAKLIKQDFASQRELEAIEDNQLLLKQQFEDVLNRVSSLDLKKQGLEYELNQLPLNHEETLASLQAKLSSLDQQISQAEAQSGFDVLSYRDGYVSNILGQNGMAVNVGTPIMTILPENTELQAELFVPTRAYGFVVEGQNTRIRYQAFPYQRFGIYEGRVAQISKSILLPNEANVPVTLTEPMYRVLVDLSSQTAQAYGDSIPLQAGMLLEADVMVDRRSLFEWLFEPLYSIKGAI